MLEQAAEAYRAGQLEQAETHARRACEADWSDEQAVLMYSGLLLHRQATPEAEVMLRKALSEGLESGPAKANLALCCGRLKKHAEAAELAREVSESQPSLVSAWNTLGAALLALKKPRQVEAEMQKALAIHKDHPALTLLLANARRDMDQHESAEEAYRTFDRQAVDLLRRAEELTLAGRVAEAEHQYRQILAARPQDSAAHAGLGRLLLRLERTDEAIAALEKAVRIEPADSVSRHFIGIAKGSPPRTAEPAYVRALFDDYADNFDDNLTGALGYRIPEEIADRLREEQADLSEVLDLGCGTGLVANALNGQFGAIDGVDLSAEMLRQAERSGWYRTLILDDIVDFFRSREQRYTTVVAADVMIYVGDFERLLKPLAQAIRPGGFFAFSIELNEGAAWSLNPKTGRYQHYPDAIDKLLINHGFAVASWTTTTIRQELDERIPGAIGLAERL